MRVFGQPVEAKDLKDCMAPKPDGPASADADGQERLRFRVLSSETGEHLGTYIGLKDGSLYGAFWMQVIAVRR
jgi:hypothetical protein